MSRLNVYHGASNLHVVGLYWAIPICTCPRLAQVCPADRSKGIKVPQLKIENMDENFNGDDWYDAQSRSPAMGCIDRHLYLFLMNGYVQRSLPSIYPIYCC